MTANAAKGAEMPVATASVICKATVTQVSLGRLVPRRLA